MTRRHLIVDSETTGLDETRHEIWELAILDREDGREHLWRMKPDLVKADPQALAVGRFYERTASDMCGGCVSPDRAYDLMNWTRRDPYEWSAPGALAAAIAPLLDGATIIGATPDFDTRFLRAFLNRHGHAATWHYRIRDIGSMAHGYLRRAPGLYHGELPPMDAGTDNFAAALGVDTGKFERHSALGDCRLVNAMLDVIEGGDL